MQLPTTMIHAKVAVIIPFYQRSAGILRRAVESALTQQGVTPPRVIVVDDGSPLDAQCELTDLLAAFPHHLEILKQANAGPGAARNTGIKHVLGSVEFIAFLDSDDSWEPTHLKIAQAALDLGFDFYFCDAIHHETNHTVFEAKKIPDADCKLVSQDLCLYEYCSDFFQLVLDRCPIATPAVMYRPSSFQHMFREDLRTAGEDYFFWLQVAYSGKRVALSTLRNVKLGVGVNIYAGVEWATNARLKQIYFNQLYVSSLPRQFSLTREQRLSCSRLITKHRQAFVGNLCSLVIAGKKVEPGLLLRYAGMDPSLLLRVPAYATSRLISALVQLFRSGKR
jgi:succinoglycan biosynthesis protein ExoW